MCVRKECQAAIRRELEQSMPLDYKRLEQLPLLDSFIKETVRFNPFIPTFHRIEFILIAHSCNSQEGIGVVHIFRWLHIGASRRNSMHIGL